jgi:hypothetical protein
VTTDIPGASYRPCRARRLGQGPLRRAPGNPHASLHPAEASTETQGTREIRRTEIGTFERAVARYGKPEMVMHDRGAAFWSWNGISRFTALLTELGIDQIVAVDKEHNGKVEQEPGADRVELRPKEGPAHRGKGRGTVISELFQGFERPKTVVIHTVTLQTRRLRLKAPDER